MTKLIRHKGTKKFWGVSGEWTDNINQAQDFLGRPREPIPLHLSEWEQIEWYYHFPENSTINYDFSIGVVVYPPAAPAARPELY